MARGGITLFLVKKARDSLLDRGQFPSIDAVRAELGNTGSKTTISRYLKELQGSTEQESPVDPMSDALKDLVSKLVNQVKEEGAQAFLQAQADLNRQRTDMLEKAALLEQERDDLQQQLVIISGSLDDRDKELQKNLGLLHAE